MTDPIHDFVLEEFNKRGKSFRQLSQKIGKSTPGISMVSSGRRRSFFIESAIASEIGFSWIDLYGHRTNGGNVMRT